MFDLSLLTCMGDAERKLPVQPTFYRALHIHNAAVNSLTPPIDGAVFSIITAPACRRFIVEWLLLTPHPLPLSLSPIQVIREPINAN